MAKPLTAKFVENVKASGKRREIPDGDMPGLYLVVQAKGVKSWAYRYRVNGVASATKKMTLGGFPQIPLSGARELAKSAAKSVSKGGDPAKEKKDAKKNSGTLEESVIQFIRRHGQQNNSKRHWQETARIFGLKVSPEDPCLLVRTNTPDSILGQWGTRTPDSITDRDVIKIIDEVFDRGSPIMANRTRAALSKFFKWAKARRIVQANPCLEIEKPAKERKRKRILSDIELQALWRAADRLGYPKGTAYKLLILSGQRLNIVAKCQATYLNRRAAEWYIREDQEGAKDRDYVLPIVPALAALFDECPHSPYLLSTTGGEKPLVVGNKIKSEIDSLMLEELRRLASGKDDVHEIELRRWTNHDLRRTMRSHLSPLPIPEGQIVKELLIGHKKQGLSEVYDRYAYINEKRIALNLWAAKLDSIVNPAQGNVVSFKSKPAG